jgi:hypothetical protein
MAYTDYLEQVQKIYIGYYGRAADPIGQVYWATQLDNAGGNLATIINAFGTSAEATTLFSGMTNMAKVNAIYQQCFHRDAEVAGLTYYTNALTAGTYTQASIMLNILNGATGTDATAVVNKLSAASRYTTALDLTAEILAYDGTTAASSARTFLATIDSITTATDAAVTAAVASMVAAVSAVSGQTYTLTTGLDSITGTTGNDTITALVDGTTAANTTIGAADTINGGAGTDVLNVVYQGGAIAGIPAASISNVETVNIRAVGTGAVTAVNMSLIPGVTAVNTDRSTQDVTVTNLASGASAGVIGDGTVTNGAFNPGYVAAATAGTLNISGGATAGAITMSGTGLTSQTVNSTGATNVIGALTLAATDTSLTVNATTKLTTGALTNTTAAALTTLTVTGAGAVSFGSTALESAVTKIDASGNSGGLTVALGTAATQAVTGSTGNDVITTGIVLTTGSVNAGTGTDTLNLGTNVAHANTASLAAKYTNFETLRVNGTFDASLIAGINAIELSGATNAITNLSATQAAAVTARADIGATTLTLTTASGTSDVLSITMGTGLTTAAATDAAALTITGFETLNLTTAAGPTAATGADRTSLITAAIVDTSLTAINLKGTAFNLSDIATTKAVTIDGSALTGDGASTVLGLTVAGSAIAGSTITGSAFKDQFTIGAEGSTYNGGAGNDTFTASTAVMTADGVTDVTVIGGAGTDTLTLTTVSAVTDNIFTNVTGMEKLTTTATSALSYTGLGAAAKAAFADGLTITSGTLADNATYTVGTGLYDKAVTLTLVSSGDGATTADNIAITTGSAADTISVTAASWVGAAGAAGLLSVSTGAGNDTISVSTGTLLAVTGTAPVIITGGTGADTITAVGVNAATGLTPTFVIAAGDSTVSAYDSITGFDMADGSLLSSTLDFASVGLTAYAATAPTGYTAAQLTVAVSSAGLVTFAGTSASGLTLADKIAAVQSVVITTAGDSALFTDGSNSYVFNNNATADSLVQLVGITGTSLVTTNATTAGAIFIT